MKFHFESFLKLRFSFFNACFKTGMLVFPIPCKFMISFSEYLANFSKVVIPSFSKALLAGAFNLDRKPDAGLFSFSHSGQTGQSLDL